MPKTTVINLARLNTLIDERGWDLRELAKRAGLSEHTLYSLNAQRRGKATSTRTLQKIADALGVAMEHLIEEQGEEVEAKPAMPPTLQELVAIARRLSDVRQEELVAIATALEQVERETEKRPMPDETYKAILDLFERMRQTKDVNPDAIELLESIIRRRPGRWFVDDWSGERTNDTHHKN